MLLQTLHVNRFLGIDVYLLYLPLQVPSPSSFPCVGENDNKTAMGELDKKITSVSNLYLHVNYI